ncbi:MAG TPA: DNA polymerase III subunit delta' [Xanthobacteraceae bacterium]
MSPTKASADEIEVPHPRATFALHGHAQAEQKLLADYKSGRIAHAWLIGGPAGIGKATLAYRMARFALAHSDPAAAAVQQATTLAVAPDSPTARRIAGRAHPDLLVLERTAGDNGKLRSVITVDEVRRTIAFFGSTAGEGGWRVCVVDAADELQYPQGSNALLKVLEEPPPRSLFLVVSHAPGRLLPTIRSRCRRLTLRPLDAADVAAAAMAALGADADEAALRQAAAAADGSVARAIALSGGPQLALRDKMIDLLGRLPATDPRALHALGDSLERGGDGLFEIFTETARDWLSAQLDRTGDARRLARAAAAWERLDHAARDAETYNLERKPFVFNVFGLLAEAARG